MNSDDDLQKLKSASVEFERLSEQERAVKPARKNLLEEHSDLLEDPSSGPFTVAELISELQKHPADMPVFGWIESEAPEIEEGIVPTPYISRRLAEIAQIGPIHVVVDDFKRRVGEENALELFDDPPMMALLLGGD